MSEKQDEDSNPEITYAEVREIELTRYCVECPNCGEWHEHEESHVRRIVDCICGCNIKVTK